MDSEGYPQEEELTMIREWDVKDFPALLQFVEERWTWHDFIKREVIKDGEINYLKWTLITGGWSGNESLVNAVLSNQLFQMAWYFEWKRGGKHTFRIDPRNVGYQPVSEYCKKNNVSKQWISKAKKLNKFQYFRMTPNRVYIRPIEDLVNSMR